MDIVVLYATSEGQTRKIAEYAADCLHRRDHSVTTMDVADAKWLDLSAYDAAILASRVHAGRHHPAMISFVRRNVHLLRAMDTAFISVSISRILRRFQWWTVSSAFPASSRTN